MHITQYDGLARTSIQKLTPIVEAMKHAWKVQRASIQSTWEVPQHRMDSCGTIALAHFGLSIGLLTWDQAMQFEALHESLAICGSMSSLHSPKPIGLGAEENAIIRSLEHILPSHGAPPTEVKARAQAAIKVFGIPAITRALGAKNTWKQLGNSRPMGFHVGYTRRTSESHP